MNIYAKDWPAIIRLINAAPAMLDALEDIAYKYMNKSDAAMLLRAIQRGQRLVNEVKEGK